MNQGCCLRMGRVFFGQTSASHLVGGFPGNFLTVWSGLTDSLSEHGTVATSSGQVVGNHPTLFLFGTEMPNL